jgi:hypothetical protein
VNEAAHLEREALWAAGEAREHERQRRAMDAERLLWHTGQAQRLKETMMQLVTHHEKEARKILEGEA